MKISALLPAVSSEPIFAKSKFYIQRALKRKQEDDLDEYQLWASLALELLGKASLARIHPSLIVDPTHAPSLLAASGLNLSTDIKTIAAHTLFERLRHIIPKFEEPAKIFCNAIAQRRNAELHSGDTPFKTMKLDAWEAQYWHAAQLILTAMSSSLDAWLGATVATAPKQLLEHAATARKDAVRVRVAQANEDFTSKKKPDRERLLTEAHTRESYHYKDLFKLLSDANWSVACPACGGKAYVAGMLTYEDILDTSNEPDGIMESVEKSFSAEEFHCPVCDLRLEGADELEAAGVNSEHTEVEDRQQEYEPDYGNC
jgi:hypothetical protein